MLSRTDRSPTGRSERKGRKLAIFLKRHVNALRRDEGGSLIVFALFMFVLMLMIGGLAVDVMRFETTRSKLQNTLDRAILAAADLDQTLDPQAVVEDYFAKAGMSNFLVSVNVDQGLNYRTVSATTSADVKTIFMGLMGINTLTAPAQGTAEERVSNVEISLVLDISGSMGSNNKIANLRTAAKQFVNTVIRTEALDLISLSLVPYTAQVNAGPNIFYQLFTPSNPNQTVTTVVNGSEVQSTIPTSDPTGGFSISNLTTRSTALHNYSQCIDFEQSDFQRTGLDYTKTYTQMQHFEWSTRYYSDRTIDNPGCPQQTYERIVPLSQDIAGLEATIDNYRARANTAIHLGMKWGTLLLDPTTNPIVQNLVRQGVVDNAFNTRPAAWDDPETMKVVVLMTDGQNVNTYRIEDWAYNSESEYVHWSRYSLWWYLYNYVSSSNRSRYYDMLYSASQADQMLSNICGAAKAQGIIVFTIGFEVNNTGANVMQDCASSPSHFFRVEGVEISEAFNAIARQINQLRLTL
ncbi:MAG: pilus assembly protein TadG-related protein [Halocynthiibacter sp.]